MSRLATSHPATSPPGGGPWLTVTKGHPTATELAAITTLIAALATPSAQAGSAAPGRSWWSDPARIANPGGVRAEIWNPPVQA